MITLISGALVMGYLVAGLFFLRFFRETRDRLFLSFGAAFWLLAVQRAALVMLNTSSDDSLVWLYGVRLAAFMLILYAIIDKNRAPAAS